MVNLLKIAILFLLLTSSEAFALNMGTVVKNDFSIITVNESAKFTVLFWNTENENYRVKLDVKEAPEKWIVIIDPNYFILNSSFGKEYIKLPYKNDIVKAIPVDIIIKPSTTIPGKYNITVTAKSITPETGIDFSQERLFKFLVEVENPLYFENSLNESINQNRTQNLTLTNILKHENVNLNYFYVIFIMIIILFSFLIYKYS